MASNKHKSIKHSVKVEGKKIPKNIEDPNSYLKKKPVWVFNRCDRTHDKWSLKKCRNLYEEILDKLIAFEGMTWAEIMKSSGGRRQGTNNHFIKISGMVKEAQDRALEISLNEDQLFSLRLDGKKRLYGIIQNGKFCVIWYTMEHDICLSNKKHT